MINASAATWGGGGCGSRTGSLPSSKRFCDIGLSSVPWRSPAQLTRLMRVQTHDCQTALLADPSTPSPSAPPLPFIVCRLLSVGLCRHVTAVIQQPSLINSLQSSRPLAYNPHLTAE